jgi:uncharacterized membrane protein YdjX (TVP38/TMEM64 family)
VQAVVDGAAARALGDLCRDRWLRATGQEMRPTEDAGDDPWPQDVTPDLTDIDIAIARTDPGYVTGMPVEEIRRLYVDAIAAARRTLYFENQYFSSSVVGGALAARLRGAEPPEVVVVSRRTEEGWLEERTMGVLRARLHKRLQDADRNGRYRLLYPYVPGLELPNVLNVHSKVIVVDDELCSVGSANFSNRSMGFDTECNIAIEARGDPRIKSGIAAFRNRLLAEHLGTDVDRVAAEIESRSGSVLGAIDALHRPGKRTLEPIDPKVSPEVDALVPAEAVVDPERPVDPEVLVKDFVPPDARKPLVSRVWRVALGLIALGAMAAAWRWTPLRELVSLASMVRIAQSLQESPIAPLAVLAAYVVAGLLVIPITVMIVATGVVFGPFLGAIYALCGAILSAAVTYSLGRHLGRNAVRRLAGSRLNRITRRLAKKGVLAIAAVRLLPIAPFTVVNAVAGASQIVMRDFLLGTAIGLSPGIIVTVVFVDRVAEAVTNPRLGTIAVVAAFLLVLLAAALYVHRRFRSRPAAPIAPGN